MTGNVNNAFAPFDGVVQVFFAANIDNLREAGQIHEHDFKQSFAQMCEAPPGSTTYPPIAFIAEDLRKMRYSPVSFSRKEVVRYKSQDTACRDAETVRQQFRKQQDEPD
jgi:hypothetical protein